MNIVQITPGAGAMFCGNCFRDNALVKALRQQGHEALMVPLYLPLTLDEEDQSRGTPLFFNGVNVYLEQKYRWFRNAPAWVHRVLGSKAILKFAASRAAKTRAADLGELTISMIEGEAGKQAREIEQLIAFLKTQPKPDVICLSNALLVGMARRIKAELKIPIACVLQGEDTFLDALPPQHRSLAWNALKQRCEDIDLFLPPSNYFSELMSERLALPAHRVRVIYDGINLDGYESAQLPTPPAIGYFARMCPQKGLDTLVEAFVILKKRVLVPGLKLRIGGGCGPSDVPFVDSLVARLKTAGCFGDVEFFPNVDRAGKLAFLRSLTVFSVPALYGEAFGLYVIEALASGVPVVQPEVAAFPELVELTGGGILCEPANPQSLADTLQVLLLDQPSAKTLGEAGRKAVQEKFSAGQMAKETIAVFEEMLARTQPEKTGASRP